MTIAMLVCDPPNVLVAAERRFTAPVQRDGQQFVVQFEMVKVHVHPTLPLVWTSAGSGKLPYRGQQRYLEDLVMQAWADPHEPFDPVNSLRFLAPLVQKEMTADPDTIGVGLLIGMWTGDRVLAANVGINKTFSVWNVEQGAILPSAHTHAFFESLSWTEKLPRRGSTPDKIAKHMRQLIGQAIKAAQKLAGDEADVGGDVDVVMVGPHGAKILP